MICECGIRVREACVASVSAAAGWRGNRPQDTMCSSLRFVEEQRPRWTEHSMFSRQVGAL